MARLIALLLAILALLAGCTAETGRREAQPSTVGSSTGGSMALPDQPDDTLLWTDCAGPARSCIPEFGVECSCLYLSDDSDTKYRVIDCDDQNRQLVPERERMCAEHGGTCVVRNTWFHVECVP